MVWPEIDITATSNESAQRWRNAVIIMALQ